MALEGRGRNNRVRKKDSFFLFVCFFQLLTEVQPQSIRSLTKFDVPFAGRAAAVKVTVTDSFPDAQTFWFPEKWTLFLLVSHLRPPSLFTCSKKYVLKETGFAQKSISPLHIVWSQSRSQYAASRPAFRVPQSR